MIRTDGLCRAFGGRQALAPLSTHFERGRVTVLLGPSGCGKSTLLRLLIGLLVPDAGSVEIDGVTLGPATVEAIRHRTGYVIQDGGLFPHLTARDNITLLARHLRWDGGRIAARLATVAAGDTEAGYGYAPGSSLLATVTVSRATVTCSWGSHSHNFW
jgi:osmoprotectant transport system ATP-binding protein